MAKYFFEMAVYKGMNLLKRIIIAVLAMACGGGVQAQLDWMGGLTMGAAFPAGASNNAPELRTSFASSLWVRGLLKDTPVALMLSVEGVHWVNEVVPDRAAVPVDEGLYAKRYVLFPVTAGVALTAGKAFGFTFDFYAAVGFHWRNLNCQRMAAPGLMDDMEEHGWGVAWKVGAEVLHKSHLSLSVSYLAVGNPFGTGGDGLPAGTGTVHDGVRRSQPSLEGYGQGFVIVSLGYFIF